MPTFSCWVNRKAIKFAEIMTSPDITLPRAFGVQSKTDAIPLPVDRCSTEAAVGLQERNLLRQWRLACEGLSMEFR